MNTNELDRDGSVLGNLLGLDGERPSNRHHFVCEPDELEPRQLLSAVQGATSSQTTEPQTLGPTAGVGETAGFTGVGGTVVTQTTGDVGFLHLQVPVNDQLANLSQVTANVSETPGPFSISSGLLALPISPLLTPTVTENQTPLNNGTSITGTVWITEPPEPSGVFHFDTTISPVFSHLYLQMVNPQGGPPSFSHFGENSNGTLSGAVIEEPVAVGPIGPSITIEIQSAQPPPAEAHQFFGPPAQIQQDETTPPQDARTPPGGWPGGGRPGTPGQAAVPGQQGRISGLGRPRGLGASVPQPVHIQPPHPSTGWGPQFPAPVRPLFQGRPGPGPVHPPAPGGLAPVPVHPATPGRGAIPAPQPPTRRPPAAAPVQPPTGGFQGLPGTKPPAERPPARPEAPRLNGAPGFPSLPDSPPPADHVKDQPADHGTPADGTTQMSHHGQAGDSVEADLIDAAIPLLASTSDSDHDSQDATLPTVLGAAAIGGYTLVPRDPSGPGRSAAIGTDT